MTRIGTEKQTQSFDKSGYWVFHITAVMHNTRMSKRMLAHNINLGKPERLIIEEEEKFIEIVTHFIREDKLQILALNICMDHVHLVIVCSENKLGYTIGKLKSKTAREFNIWRGITIPQKIAPSQPKVHSQPRGHYQPRGHDPLANYDPKANYDPLANYDPIAKPKTLSKKGITQNSLWAQKFNRKKIYDSDYLTNVLNYIKDNRNKHNLPPLSEKAQSLINIACTDYFSALKYFENKDKLL